MTIWFDMDGTIADLYAVENWLPMLRASDPTPYAMAKPMLRLSALAYMLNGLQSLYPHAKVYYLLNSELKGVINESVYTICQRYDVPVITLYNIDKQQGHPSIAGMTAISEQIHAFLEKEAMQEEFKSLKGELQEIKSDLQEIKQLIHHTNR